MPTIQDITEFTYGEDVSVSLFLNNRDGTDLISAASQTIDFIISDRTGTQVLAFNASPQITLVDAGTAEFALALAPSDYTTLSAATNYYYDVWSTLSGGERLHQIRGTFNLARATAPA